MKVLALIAATLMVFVTLAQADNPYPGTLNLYDRGGGMVYDADLNITWLQDANYVKTSGYDPDSSDGLISWYAAMTWADNLVYGGYDDWRLPIITHEPLEFIYSNSAGEFGHLFYTELGNAAMEPLTNVGPFINLGHTGDSLNDVYWSGTEHSSNLDVAFIFYFGYNICGHWSNDVKIREFAAWAVRDGDVTPVPEPTTILLLGLGLIGLAGVRRKYKN